MADVEQDAGGLDVRVDEVAAVEPGPETRPAARPSPSETSRSFLVRRRGVYALLRTISPPYQV